MSELGVLFAALALSVAAHVVGLRWTGGARSHLASSAPASIRVVVVDKPAPPPPIETPMAQPPPRMVKMARQPPKLRTAAVKDVSASASAPDPLPLAAPIENVEVASPAAKTPIMVPGFALSATTPGGRVGVQVGNGAGSGMGRGRSLAGASGGDAKPYKAGEFVEPHALTEEPIFLRNITPEQMRSFYPEAARLAKVEASVRVKLTLDDDGSVVAVKLVAEPGHGFGAAAQKLARLYRFKPATFNGRRVATEIPFTIHFELD